MLSLQAISLKFPGYSGDEDNRFAKTAIFQHNKQKEQSPVTNKYNIPQFKGATGNSNDEIPKQIVHTYKFLKNQEFADIANNNLQSHKAKDNSPLRKSLNSRTLAFNLRVDGDGMNRTHNNKNNVSLSPLKSRTAFLTNRKSTQDNNRLIFTGNQFNKSSYKQNLSPDNRQLNSEKIYNTSGGKQLFQSLNIFPKNLNPNAFGNYMLLQEFFNKFSMADDQYKRYKCSIVDGNNSDLVRHVMKKRYWFQEIKGSLCSTADFIWKPTSSGIIYDRLQINCKTQKQLVNHFEYHREITTKIGLIKNLQSYCETNQICLFDLTPVTFIIDTEDKNFDYEVQEFIKFFNFYENPNQSGTQYLQDQNILPITNTTTTNNGNNNLKSMLGTKIITYKLQLKPNLTYSKPKKHNTFYRGSNLWLMKPTDNNRGRGINLFNTVKKFKQYLSNAQEQYAQEINRIEIKNIHGLASTSIGFNNIAFPISNPMKSTINPMLTFQNLNGISYGGGYYNGNNNIPKRSKLSKGPKFVIQKYIESPMLINNRKFDIRVWVMIDQEMNLYFFKEGYLRLSSEIFTIDESTIENKYIHLTNNAIQKYSETYGKFESGNQLSFQAFQEYLTIHYPHVDFKNMLIQMKELVMHSMLSVRSKINQNYRKYCFEIFGYDFIVDSEAKIWLIEVNTNPCIEESSPLLKMLLPRMIDDAFKLTLDKIFPPAIKKSKDPNDYDKYANSHISYTDNDKEEYQVVGYKNNENMW